MLPCCLLFGRFRRVTTHPRIPFRDMEPPSRRKIEKLRRAARMPPPPRIPCMQTFSLVILLFALFGHSPAFCALCCPGRAGGTGVLPTVIQQGRGTKDTVPLEDASWGLDVSRELDSLSSALFPGQVCESGAVRLSLRLSLRYWCLLLSALGGAWLVFCELSHDNFSRTRGKKGRKTRGCSEYGGVAVSACGADVHAVYCCLVHPLGE